MIIERKFRNINKKVSLVPYNRPIISFRTMFKLASHQGVNIRLVRLINPRLVQIRYNPNQYSAGHFSYDIRDGLGKKVPPHELGHKLIKRNSDGKIVGVVTSDPKSSFESTVIDNQTYMNGTKVPVGEVGQAVTAFNEPKIIENPTDTPTKPLFKVDAKAQAYLDKQEAALNKFYNNKGHSHEEVRVHKSDSRFYNEDGTRDYENFP